MSLNTSINVSSKQQPQQPSTMRDLKEAGISGAKTNALAISILTALSTVLGVAILGTVVAWIAVPLATLDGILITSSLLAAEAAVTTMLVYHLLCLPVNAMAATVGATFGG